MFGLVPLDILNKKLERHKILTADERDEKPVNL